MRLIYQTSLTSLNISSAWESQNYGINSFSALVMGHRPNYAIIAQRKTFFVLYEEFRTLEQLRHSSHIWGGQESFSPAEVLKSISYEFLQFLSSRIEIFNLCHCWIVSKNKTGVTRRKETNG